ncbi:hypothetical protein GCM10023167_21440 [Brevibacterium pityocampae]|uniref:Uncharacterized protein n=1 Tax=Brevibacterium pityocampae TaxID=506594 RepID=A0ABP8JLY6_9MICO
MLLDDGSEGVQNLVRGLVELGLAGVPPQDGVEDRLKTGMQGHECNDMRSTDWSITQPIPRDSRPSRGQYPKVPESGTADLCKVTVADRKPRDRPAARDAPSTAETTH